MICFVAPVFLRKAVRRINGNSVGTTLKSHIFIPVSVPSNTISQFVIHNIKIIIVNIDIILDFIVNYIFKGEKYV